jgi:hypothetical protein
VTPPLAPDDRNGGLASKMLAEMNALTLARHGGMALDNAERNRALIGRGASLKALRAETVGEGDSAIVIAAGPSIRRRDPIRAIKDSGYRGALVVTESALAYCLRNGVVPDLAVSLDPHATRVVRWFGDPALTVEALRADDYFSRQDQDAAFADEMRANREILTLLDRHGKDIRIALSTSASKAVVDRVLAAGMKIYWWNAMLDDPDAPGSVTARLQRDNGLPSVNAGGNVGSAAWMMASAVLGKRHVALTGVDFSYYDGTPYLNTQYYREAVALVGEDNLDALYVRIRNPHLDQWFFTDPAYLWYRECLMDMIADADCRTYNCTEGGIVFGDRIEFISLAEFLARHAPRAGARGVVSHRSR